MSDSELEPRANHSGPPTSLTICRSEHVIGEETTKTQPGIAILETRESVESGTEEEQVNEESFDWANVQDLTDSDFRDLVLEESEKVEKSEGDPGTFLVPLNWLLDDIGRFEDDIEDIEMTTSARISWKRAGTLLAKYRSSGGLSVTKLVSPLWCQYKANYDLVGGPKRGSKERPKEFTVQRKEIVNKKLVIKEVVIKVDQNTAEVREKNAERGRAIHEKLEKEVAPVAVKTISSNREEKWGFKILALITGFKQLIEYRLWRELPVFGIIDDIPVNGIIDQLQLRRVHGKGSGDSGGVVGMAVNSLIISDIKTKKKWTPHQDLSASPEHKFQLMIYKKLLDDLISPEYDWDTLFKLHNLDPKITFSDFFIDQQISISRANNFVSLVADCTTLEDLVLAWKSITQEANIIRGKVDRVLRVEFRIPSRTGRWNQVPTDSDSTNESDLLAIKSFRYDGDFIKNSIATSLGFWLGSQPTKGVRVEETWKCNVCEYKDSCEWRQKEASRLGPPVGTPKAQLEITMEKSVENR
ncbi:hypothetical protein FRC19_011085 [Serendipita sp. 401]|nr:hypothetical protein FRC19_011085 [Serendipita sp. 401]KAG9056428.1 hypothetical protein FS842_010699 [Serendipita sp. 407]